VRLGLLAQRLGDIGKRDLHSLLTIAIEFGAALAQAGVPDDLGHALDGLLDLVAALLEVLDGDVEDEGEVCPEVGLAAFVLGQVGSDERVALCLVERAPLLGVGFAGFLSRGGVGPLAGDERVLDQDVEGGAVVREDATLAVEHAASDGGRPAIAKEAGFGVIEQVRALDDGQAARLDEQGSQTDGESSAQQQQPPDEHAPDDMGLAHAFIIGDRRAVLRGRW
jgi:hypothetical protein